MADRGQVVSADWERRLPGAAGRAAEDDRQARRDRFSDGTGRHPRGTTARGAKGYERGKNALPGLEKTQEARSGRPITVANHPSAKGRPIHFTVAGGPLCVVEAPFGHHSPLPAFLPTALWRLHARRAGLPAAQGGFWRVRQAGSALEPLDGVSDRGGPAEGGLRRGAPWRRCGTGKPTRPNPSSRSCR